MMTRRRPAAARWSLRLEGEPALVAPDGSTHALERRAAALFALVVLEPGVSRRRVASLLWPESSEANARQALRQQLLRLKKLGGGELLEGEVSLRLANHVASDLGQDGPGGPLLGAHDYSDGDELAHWVEQKRHERRNATLRKLELRLANAESAGDAGASAAIAEQLLAVDPDNERYHRTLMRVHYLAGDLSRAQAAYERLRAMLAREFGARPSAETEQLARTLVAARAGPVVGASRAAPPASVLRPPRMVGRDREWRFLEDRWNANGAAIVVGVAGMGKTRLVTDFAARRGGVAMVAVRPGDALVAYSLLARLSRLLVAHVPALSPELRRELARLLPELGKAQPLRDEADLLRLLRSVETLLEEVLACGLAGIVLDDLHYADAASIDALRGSFAAQRRFPLIVACRGDEIDARGQALIEALVSSGEGCRLDLGPLSEPQVAELLRSLDLPHFDDDGVASGIARHTGGNPLFILETVKLMLQENTLATGTAELPVAASVTDLIGRRLGRLSKEAMRIARCAAVAGPDFSAALVADVLGARTLDLNDAWAELEMAQVLRDGAFAHDLIHEAALTSVPAALARNLHAQIATWLESAGSEPARIAAHWVAARRHREAGNAFLRAAAHARACGRRIEEAGHLERAAAAYERCGEPDARFEALLARADAMMCNDLGDATKAAVRLAQATARSDDQRLRALLKKSEFLGNRSEAALAVDEGMAGIELARASGRPDLEALFSIVVAGGLCELRRVDEALALLEPLRHWTGTPLAPRAHAEMLIQLGIALDLANRLGDALATFEAARQIAGAGGHKDLLATALSNLATTTSKRGQLTRAVEFGRQALQLWRESESLKGTPLQTQVLLAHRLRDIGHYAEAVPLFEEALEEFRRTGTRHWVCATAHRLALAFSHLGQHARARKLMLDDPAGLPAKVQAMWIAHRAEVARVSGGEALAPIREALSMLGAEVDDGNNRLVMLIATAIVPPDEGESMATAVAAWAAARERFGMATAAHARAADCALAQGALERAQPQAEAALRLFADHEPDNFYRAEVWWVAARVFEASNRQAEADRIVLQAKRWLDQIASRHVCEEFRDSFVHRNPVNRGLLTAALRLPRNEDPRETLPRPGRPA